MADGLVADRLVGPTVGTDEQPLGLPLLVPLLSGETGPFDVVAGLGEAPASSADTDRSLCEAALDPGHRLAGGGLFERGIGTGQDRALVHPDRRHGEST